MGMTPEQYWDGESWLKKSYRKAYRLRMENEEKIRDRDAWLQGIYIREAIASVPLLVNGFVPKGAHPHDYPEKPRLMEAEEKKRAETQQQKKEREMQLSMAMFHAMTEKFNANLRKRLEKEKQEKAVAT